MTSTPRHSQPPPDDVDPATDSPSPRPAPWKEAVLQGTTILITSMALAWMLRLLISESPARAEWTLQVLLAFATLLASGWQAVQRHFLWNTPVRKLREAVPKVLSGDLSIECLSEIKGGPSPLVPLIQQLLREIRHQKAELIKAEQEIGQRVASRTDALERAMGSLKIKAMRDPLTGLYNRRALDEHLPQIVERRCADGRPLSVLMIDVDYFKQLNDTLGHAAGDELLRNIGQIIRSSVRDTDLGFRYGGDEFAVVLDGADTHIAKRLADRLISLVDALAKPLKVTRAPRLSIGISRLCDLADPSPHALLEQADRMLYEVKGARKRSA